MTFIGLSKIGIRTFLPIKCLYLSSLGLIHIAESPNSVSGLVVATVTLSLVFSTL